MNNMSFNQLTNNILLCIIILIITILSIASAILAIFYKPIINLNENQILYIFSTAAQVIAGLYGLTLAGYVFLESKLNDRAKEDKTLYDPVEALKNKYYFMIIAIGMLCILSILLSLLDIATYDFLIKSPRLYSYMLNQTIVFIVSEIILIVLFSWSAINPNNITQISDRLKGITKRHLLKEEDSDKTKGNFTEFLKNYNMLEELIISYASELIMNGDWKYGKEYMPRIIKSLEILNSHEIINGRLRNEINELRKYRNFTVHGTDFSVDSSILDRTKEIYDALNKIYTVRNNEEERTKAIVNLYKISK